MHSCLYLHFYRISPNWWTRGEKPSCCPEWNIPILWPSGRHSKVFTHAALPLKPITRHFGLLWHTVVRLVFGLQNRQCDCVCSADDLLCIVMEYCSGGDLLQRIHQQKTTQFCVDDVGLNYLQLLILCSCFVLLFKFSFIEIFFFFLPDLEVACSNVRCRTAYPW